MKTLLRLIPFLALGLVSLRAADDKRTAAIAAADDARVAATIAADNSKLGTLLSDDLRYSHSSGTVDTKESFLAGVAGGRLKYTAVTYDERTIKPVAPGVALMTGRGHFIVMSNGQPNDLVLAFLAVWREESGHWRMLAWQSCRLNPPAAAKK